MSAQKDNECRQNFIFVLFIHYFMYIWYLATQSRGYKLSLQSKINTIGWIYIHISVILELADTDNSERTSIPTSLHWQ